MFSYFGFFSVFVYRTLILCCHKLYTTYSVFLQLGSIFPEPYKGIYRLCIVLTVNVFLYNLCLLLCFFNQLNVVPKMIEFLSMTLQVRRTEVPILLSRYINECSSMLNT